VLLSTRPGQTNTTRFHGRAAGAGGERSSFSRLEVNDIVVLDNLGSYKEQAVRHASKRRGAGLLLRSVRGDSPPTLRLCGRAIELGPSAGVAS
jgi:hypothetical protein